MKGIPVKFRGRDTRGNTFYGVFNEGYGMIDDLEYAAGYSVDPDSVCQLIGYDDDGKEIYEGDKIKLGTSTCAGTVYWSTGGWCVKVRFENGTEKLFNDIFDKVYLIEGESR